MFVAELHDTAKLVDRSTLNVELQRLGLGTVKGQSFKGVQWDLVRLPEPATDTWKAIIKHEGDRDWEDLTTVGPDATSEEVECRRQRFLVTLADRFSSSIARQPRPDDQEFRVVKKLWGAESQDRTIKDFSGLRDMLAFLSGDPSWDQFVSRYEEALRSIPEDLRAPFTSLYNHVRLAGKISRVMAHEVSLAATNGGWSASFLGVGAGTVDEAHGSRKKKRVGEWKFRLVKLYIEFPHYVVRLQDLNILGERRNAIRALAETHPDHVLYFTEDFALLFFPEWKWEVLHGLEDFQCRVRLVESDLAMMSSSLDTSGKFSAKEARNHGARVRELRWPVDVPDIITGTLCCVCQLKSATEKWVKGGIEEWLCRKCFERRETASPAEEYAKWDDLGIDVAWIKLALWPDLIREAITGLFAQAVNNDPETLSDFRSLPLEMDFLDDFSKVCSEWHTHFCEIVVGEQLIEPVLDYAELLILRLDAPQLWLHAVGAFQDALARHMPKLVEPSNLGSPVQLFVDISSTKFPFHEHWRYFSRPRKAINIRNVAKGIELSFSVEEFRQVLAVAQSAENRRPLHELSTLWEATGSRAAVLLSAWERRLTLEQSLRSLGHSVIDLVQFARLVTS